MKRTDSASRTMAAPATTIYRAFTDPAALVEWLPPAGMRARFERFDLRVGGGYRLVLTYDEPPAGGGKASESTDVVDAEYLELVPDERVVQRVRFDSADPAFAGAMTMTWRLAPVDGGTEVQIIAQDVPDGISKADHDAGLRSTLDHLAAYVTAKRPDRA